VIGFYHKKFPISQMQYFLFNVQISQQSRKLDLSLQTEDNNENIVIQLLISTF